MISARELCLRMLDEWENSRTGADEILHTALDASALDSRDRAFATEMFLGMLRHLAELDFVIDRLSHGNLDDAIDRLGAHVCAHRQHAFQRRNDRLFLSGGQHIGEVANRYPQGLYIRHFTV